MNFAAAVSSGRGFFRSVKNVPFGPTVVAIAYYVGAQTAFLIGTLSDKIFAPFWPPNTILLCALLAVPMRSWGLYILAAFPAHIAAELGVGMGVVQLLVAFATNCAVAVLSAVAIRTVIGGPPWLATLRKTWLYILIAAFASPGLAAFGGAFVPVLGGGAIARFWDFWAQWYASNALGALVLAPPALIWMHQGKAFLSARPLRKLAEAAFLAGSLVVVCNIVFDLSSRGSVQIFTPALISLPVLFIAWAAFRFGAKGATLSTLLVTVIAIYRSLSGTSLFASSDSETTVLALQTFIISLSAPMLLLGTAIDETKNAEQATRQSEERMAFAAASARAGLWESNLKTQLFWASHYCRSLFGLSHETELTRESLLSAVHPDDWATAADAMRIDPSAGEPALCEFRVILPNDDVRWIASRAHVYRDDDHRPIRIGGIFFDITQRKHDEIEAEQRRRDVIHLTRVSILGELSGAIAHELNQPLTAILSNAQAACLLLSRPSPSVSDAIEAIEDIAREDTRASEVIARLRGLLRKGEMKFEAVDVNKVIEATLRLVHSELICRRVKINLELAQQLPTILGDPVQLEQVVLNLVMNAAEAMADSAPTQRVLTVTTSLCQQDQVKTTIADRGPGISRVDKGRLGEAFFTTKKHGLGLGLSICSTIVKSHGGSLTLENNPDGSGAKATFVLPTRRKLCGG
jgi:signal transduction histidine kinase/integral membrane sensor domain MASE1